VMEGDADSFDVRSPAVVAIYLKFAAKTPTHPALAELITPVSPHKLALSHAPLVPDEYRSSL
jgi:hypothetical protein